MTLADDLQTKRLQDADQVRRMQQQRAMLGAQEKPFMATTTATLPVIVATPAPKQNAFASFLKSTGHVAHKVLAWLASPANQQVAIATEELGAVAASIAAPELALPIQAGLKIAERFTQDIFKTEALGAAAAASATSADPAITNAQKAAVVMAAAGPEVIQIAKEAGLNIDLAGANNALVAFWNSLSAAQQPAQ